MGYTTDFIGRVDIEPPLNEHEVMYLSAFAKTRHCERPGGMYAVSGNPYAGEEGLTTDRMNALPLGMPGYWCDWEPCWDGCCLSFNGDEKFYSPAPWLRFLIAHFLKPGALASKSGEEWFEEFTFDHVLKGMIVGCRRDNKELFAIHVARNRVTKKILRRADARYLDFPPLPYEAAIDRMDESRARRRQRRGAGGDVISLIERRA
jgi:hypothetical protein